jgi:hypothetical protein
MSNIFELLGKIEQKPGLYIGNASLTALRQFLVGYKFARQEMGILPIDEELDFYQNFQPWLQIRFHVQTVNSWDKIILFKYIDEKTAFASFFQLGIKVKISTQFWSNHQKTTNKLHEEYCRLA